MRSFTFHPGPRLIAGAGKSDNLADLLPPGVPGSCYRLKCIRGTFHSLPCPWQTAQDSAPLVFVAVFASMWAWGVGSEFVVELLGNGVIWRYELQYWNPVWITLNGRMYTLLPQFIWTIAPIVFYAGAIFITRATQPRPAPPAAL